MFTVEAISLQDRNTDISVKKFITNRKAYCTLIIQCSEDKNSHRSVPYDAQCQRYPARHSAGFSRPITDVAIGRVVSTPAEYAGGTGLVRPQCCRARRRLDDSRPDVNRSWRRRRFMTTADADALMSHAGKTAERSAGCTVGRPSICSGDGERVVTTAQADALVSRARGRQLNSRLNAP